MPLLGWLQEALLLLPNKLDLGATSPHIGHAVSDSSPSTAVSDMTRTGHCRCAGDEKALCGGRSCHVCVRACLRVNLHWEHQLSSLSFYLCPFFTSSAQPVLATINFAPMSIIQSTILSTFVLETRFIRDVNCKVMYGNSFKERNQKSACRQVWQPNRK